MSPFQCSHPGKYLLARRPFVVACSSRRRLGLWYPSTPSRLCSWSLRKTWCHCRHPPLTCRCAVSEESLPRLQTHLSDFAPHEEEEDVNEIHDEVPEDNRNLETIPVSESVSMDSKQVEQVGSGIQELPRHTRTLVVGESPEVRLLVPYPLFS